MRRLYPAPDPSAHVDAVAAYVDVDRTAPPGRPWVVVNMISSTDGATALAGRSGGLGGPGDRAIFQTLRAASDVVVVGSGTFTAERYGPPRVSEELQRVRNERGLTAQPRIAVVTGRLGFDLGTPFFVDSPTLPIVVTAQGSDPRRRQAAAAVAEVLVCGSGSSVDAGAAIDALGRVGAGVVVCEGGPTLNADLAAADVVDELCLTVAPLIGGGHTKTLFAGVDLSEALDLRLEHVLEGDDGYLFLRYVRQRP